MLTLNKRISLALGEVLRTNLWRYEFIALEVNEVDADDAIDTGEVIAEAMVMLEYAAGIEFIELFKVAILVFLLSRKGFYPLPF